MFHYIFYVIAVLLLYAFKIGRICTKWIFTD